MLTVDAMMVDQGRAVLTEIMEDFYKLFGREDLLEIESQSVVEGVDLLNVEEVAVPVEAKLEQRNRLVP